jgi:hypothetical protein
MCPWCTSIASCMSTGTPACAKPALSCPGGQAPDVTFSSSSACMARTAGLGMALASVVLATGTLPARQLEHCDRSTLGHAICQTAASMH